MKINLSFYYVVLTLEEIFQIFKDEKEKQWFIPELFMNFAVIYTLLEKRL